MSYVIIDIEVRKEGLEMERIYKYNLKIIGYAPRVRGKIILEQIYRSLDPIRAKDSICLLNETEQEIKKQYPNFRLFQFEWKEISTKQAIWRAFNGIEVYDFKRYFFFREKSF